MSTLNFTQEQVDEMLAKLRSRNPKDLSQDEVACLMMFDAYNAQMKAIGNPEDDNVEAVGMMIETAGLWLIGKLAHLLSGVSYAPRHTAPYSIGGKKFTITIEMEDRDAWWKARAARYVGAVKEPVIIP